MTDLKLEDALDKHEAAAFLHCTPRHLEKVPFGDLPYSKPAGRRLYRRAALLAYLVTLEQRGAA